MNLIFNKNTIVSAAALLGLTAGLSAQAADFEDYARVVSVQPQVEQVNTPRQECNTAVETVQRQPQQERGIGGSIIGGIAGGLLGSTVGGGTGRTVAAAAGAITGAVVGDRVENNPNNNNNGQPVYDQRQVRQCHMVDRWETRTTGYAVTYEYQRKNYTTVLPYDPGARLKLLVSLTPRI
ncbi:glycine zipper 2TM domain-containing protein [Undibacterium sp.]|uniref:glycine zipper 2TM domain-containing protein n=1 Tax=Undibacterium sp. TaxID=1914977 RepID=UPI00374C8A00